jgi:molybdopterin-guanine dinucleotide biosynthesis protein A
MSADLGQAGVILLAGGESRRMDRDKAALPLPGGKTPVRHAVDRCAALGFGRILLSGRTGVSVEGAEAVADEQTGAGPIMDVLSCLRRAEFKWNFVWPVDMPFLPDTVIKDMASALFRGKLTRWC